MRGAIYFRLRACCEVCRLYVQVSARHRLVAIILIVPAVVRCVPTALSLFGGGLRTQILPARGAKLLERVRSQLGCVLLLGYIDLCRHFELSVNGGGWRNQIVRIAVEREVNKWV